MRTGLSDSNVITSGIMFLSTLYCSKYIGSEASLKISPFKKNTLSALLI